MVHEVPDIQHRGVHIIMNLVETDKEVAQRIVESNMFEVNSMNLGHLKILCMQYLHNVFAQMSRHPVCGLSLLFAFVRYKRALMRLKSILHFNYDHVYHKG